MTTGISPPAPMICRAVWAIEFGPIPIPNGRVLDPNNMVGIIIKISVVPRIGNTASRFVFANSKPASDL